jgi:anaphase-promoting complex subunit 2
MTVESLFNFRERDNTVSCILTGLMGDEMNDMWTELISNPLEGGWTVGEEEPGYFDDMNWEPTPIDAAPGITSMIILIKDYRKTTSGDIMSMLFNIYDTKEVFVKELQIILAERLLSSKEYDVEHEVHRRLSKLTEDTSYRANKITIWRCKYSILRCHVKRYD